MRPPRENVVAAVPRLSKGKGELNEKGGGCKSKPQQATGAEQPAIQGKQRDDLESYRTKRKKDEAVAERIRAKKEDDEVNAVGRKPRGAAD